MKKHTLYTLLGLAFFSPVITLAAFAGVKGLLTAFSALLNPFIKITFGLAFIYFFWGVGQFILHAGDVKVREDGKQKMLWGVIALFVMFSIFGILRWIGSEINIVPGSGSTPSSPTSNFLAV